MASSTVVPPPRRLSFVDWLICIIAAIGFAFDIYELLMMPLIIRPALSELLGVEFLSPAYKQWAQLLFYVPMFVGGLLGLVGGYLTDLFGRRRVLTGSILLYAFSAFAAGFSTNIWMLLVFRCLTLAGVCIEFVAATAWLAELFPNPRQRESVLGVTQAFSSVGGFLVSAASLLATQWAESLPAIAGGHAPWRYTLISGVIPALPLILIRPFLPESPAWQKRKREGTLRRPSFAEIFSPALWRTTVVTTLGVALSYGAAFGAVQQLPQIVPGLVDVEGLAKPQAAKLTSQTVATVQLWQEVGGLVGRALLAGLVIIFLSRPWVVRLFQVPGIVLLPIVFFVFATSSLTQLQIGIFFVGLLVVSQFSFWGNYLPQVYPLHLRGTGESFAANVGGRIIGTSAALVTINLSGFMEVAGKEAKFSHAAAIVGTTVFVLGFLLSFFLPKLREDLSE